MILTGILAARQQDRIFHFYDTESSPVTCTMNPAWEDDANEEEEEESLGYDKGFTYGKDAVIFLIDASQEMFVEEDDETPFQLCLKCARTTLTNKIISSNKDLTAIVFFGTEKSKNAKNASDFKHIYVFQELGEPGAERVLETDELMEMEPEEFERKYGHSKDFSLADALWTCSIIFSNCTSKLAHKRILLFTCEDSPHENDKQLQLQAKTKAKDLFDVGIDTDLMHIQKSDKVFDVSRFYKDIIFSSEDEPTKLPDASEKFEDLLTRVRSKDHKKRPSANVRFTLGDGLQIGVSVYRLVSTAFKPSAVKLSKADNAELKSMTKSFLADTGEILLPTDIKKYQEYGGKKIYLEQDEVKQLKSFGETGLLLMGFKPQSMLKPHHHISPCQFIYPDEKSIEGSTRLFFALLQQCQKRKYVPICRLISRYSNAPTLVALIPQEEEVDDRGAQVIPPGFHVLFLPYMEDLRSLSTEGRHKPQEALVEKAKEIIKKLQFSYHPESFENPVLQKHWRNIEALALNSDAPEEMTDYTMPSRDIMEKRAGKLIDELKALIGAEEMDISVSQKRKMNPSAGAATKRARMADVSDLADVEKMAEANKLNQLKVNVLKEYCKTKGIKCGSKKDEMIKAIQIYVGEK